MQDTPLLIQALQSKPVARPPVWLMRQAGRYLPEYRAVRAKFPDFLSFCLHSEAATQVTLQPIMRFNLDAAIIFADILTIPHALGHKVTFTAGEGPQVEKVTDTHQISRLSTLLPALTSTLAPIAQTIRNTRSALAADKAVIGFSGAPFTLATYLLDDKPSQGIPHTLKLAEESPDSFQELIKILTQAIIPYLSMQIEAGANAVQIFDSWAGSCPPSLWDTAVHQPLLALRKELALRHPQTPVILFPRRATPAQLHALAAALPPLTGLSLSTEVDITWASHTLQSATLTIQGNLDPTLLTMEDLAPLEAALRHALATAGSKPGYIVNLGHGLTPETHIEHVARLAEMVQNHVL